MNNSRKQLECFLGQFSGFYQMYLHSLSFYFGDDKEAVRHYFPYSPIAPSSTTRVITPASPEDHPEDPRGVPSEILRGLPSEILTASPPASLPAAAPVYFPPYLPEALIHPFIFKEDSEDSLPPFPGRTEDIGRTEDTGRKEDTAAPERTERPAAAAAREELPARIISLPGDVLPSPSGDTPSAAAGENGEKDGRTPLSSGGAAAPLRSTSTTFPERTELPPSPGRTEDTERPEDTGRTEDTAAPEKAGRPYPPDRTPFPGERTERTDGGEEGRDALPGKAGNALRLLSDIPLPERHLPLPQVLQERELSHSSLTRIYGILIRYGGRDRRGDGGSGRLRRTGARNHRPFRRRDVRPVSFPKGRIHKVHRRPYQKPSHRKDCHLSPSRAPSPFFPYIRKHRYGYGVSHHVLHRPAGG